MQPEDNASKAGAKPLLPASYLVVLNFIANGPKYGYQIIQLLKTRNYREWLDLEDSAVYRSLHDLEKRGLIASALDKEAPRVPRRVYSITPQGRRIHRQQIFQCLSNPPRPKSLFDLGISAMRVLPQNQILEALQIHRNQLHQRFRYLQSIRKTLENIDIIRETDPDRHVGKTPVSKIPLKNLAIIYALFDRPYQVLRAEIHWLDTFIQQIQKNPI